MSSLKHFIGSLSLGIVLTVGVLAAIPASAMLQKQCGSGCHTDATQDACQSCCDQHCCVNKTPCNSIGENQCYGTRNQVSVITN